MTHLELIKEFKKESENALAIYNSCSTNENTTDKAIAGGFLVGFFGACDLLEVFLSKGYDDSEVQASLAVVKMLLLKKATGK